MAATKVARAVTLVALGLVAEPGMVRMDRPRRIIRLAWAAMVATAPSITPTGRRAISVAAVGEASVPVARTAVSVASEAARMDGAQVAAWLVQTARTV